jgi:hypothetical protein
MIRRKYNPGASATNLTVISQTDSGCCNDALTDCQYVATWTIASTDTLVSLTMIDSAGDTQVYTFPSTLSDPAPSDASAINTALTDWIESNGYVVEGKSVVVEVTATTVTATFTGQAVFTANEDTDAAYVITPACVKSVECTYSFTTNGNGASAVPVSKNGTTGTLTAFTIATAAATVQGYVEGFFTGSTVTVIRDTDAGVFEITVSGAPEDLLYIDGAQGLKCCCTQVYSEA